MCELFFFVLSPVVLSSRSVFAACGYAPLFKHADHPENIYTTDRPDDRGEKKTIRPHACVRNFHPGVSQPHAR